MMEKCFFNNCVLNEEGFFKKYKKYYPNNKKIFINFDIKEEDGDLVKLAGIGTKVKKVTMCNEHFEMYKKLKELRHQFTNFIYKFDKGEKPKSDELEQFLNIVIVLTKHDTSLRKLMPKYLDGFFEFLLEISNNHDPKIRNYILIIIFNMFKEVVICETFGSHLFEPIFNNFIKLNVILYQEPLKEQKDKREEQKLSKELDISEYLYTLHIINITYNNMKEKVDSELVLKIVNKLITDLDNITDSTQSNNIEENYKETDIKLFKKNMETQIFEVIITTLHSFIISKYTEIDIRVFICSNVIENTEKYTNFLTNSDFNSKKLMICFNYEILFIIFNSKLEYFSDKVENYLINLKRFLLTFDNKEQISKFKGLSIFIDKIPEIIKLMEEKMKRYKNENPIDIINENNN